MSDYNTTTTSPNNKRSGSGESKGSKKFTASDLLLNNTPSATSLMSEIEAPEDKGGKVNIIFFFWGIGTLLPWNAVLSCFDFFSTEMDGFKPAFIYPFAVNGFLAVTQIYMIVQGYKYTDRFKVQYAFYVGSVLIFSLPLLAHFLGSPAASFWSCFGVLLLFGIVNGCVQGQVFGLASVLPGKYIGSVMFGQGVSGIAMNSLRLVFVIFLGD
jgi:hypothetical protein